jgi:putative restriction endonuclease
VGVVASACFLLRRLLRSSITYRAVRFRPATSEVDFWQPSPHGFKAIPPGAPFFFRLGAPHKAIAGFGFFARYERVPAWLAWESFGDKNGTDTFAEMAARIEAIRRRTGSALLARPQDYEVGCIMISQPVFFPRDDWVTDPADWHPRIQGGKTIDVASGDGRRVLAACLERAARLRPGAEPLAAELRRYGAPQVVQPRLGQGTFRIAVTSAYGACAVTGEHSLPALEAAHVRPDADGGAHALPNGLLLRADIHRLYDAGYVTVTPDHRFRVSHDLFADFHNGREYERFARRAITVPPALTDQPDPELLDWHAAEVFRG